MAHWFFSRKASIQEPPRSRSHSQASLTHNITFSDLPYEIQLIILAYLTPRELCHASMVCKSWNQLASDNYLWRKLLNEEINTWEVISNSNHPNHQMRHWSAKQTYLRCSPNVPRACPENSQWRNFFHMLTPVFSKSACPKIAMFGPALETNADHLMHNLMWGETSPFRVKGMFPGQDGFGSGVWLVNEESKVEFNLITLYETTKAERDQHAQISKIRDGESSLSPKIQEICKTIDAFVFVVDCSTLASPLPSSSSPSSSAAPLPTVAEAAVNEMKLFLSSRWTRASAPILTFACSKPSSPSLPCITVAELLNLGSLSRDWQIRALDVDSFGGPYLKGISWLLNLVNS